MSTDEPITINLQEFRKDDAGAWDLPPWGYILAQGIYPLFASTEEHLIPVGTGFSLSPLGIVATAERSLRKARKALRGLSGSPGEIGLAALHQHEPSKGELEWSFLPLEGLWGADAADATDVGYGFSSFQAELPTLPFRASFAVPRIGSRVICIGYTDTWVSGGRLRHDQIQPGSFDWLGSYQHTFRAVEARVTHIFTEGFASGFIPGACFTIDAEVGAGLCGGPVFNEQGYVCGVVSAGASQFFDQPSSIVSLLYPTLLSDIQFSVSLGQALVTASRPLIHLVQQGAVVTDGSEDLVSVLPEGEKFRIGPLIHEDDGAWVHHDFAEYQESLRTGSALLSRF